MQISYEEKTQKPSKLENLAPNLVFLKNQISDKKF